MDDPNSFLHISEKDFLQPFWCWFVRAWKFTRELSLYPKVLFTLTVFYADLKIISCKKKYHKRSGRKRTSKAFMVSSPTGNHLVCQTNLNRLYLEAFIVSVVRYTEYIGQQLNKLNIGPLKFASWKRSVTFAKCQSLYDNWLDWIWNLLTGN